MITRHHIVAVLLAGGQARRMGGGDKCLKTVAGQTLLELVIARIAPQASHLVINANGDPARFARFGIPVAADSIDGFAGPLAGVLAGLDWAAANAAEASHVVSIATDTPFFPTDLVARLAAGAGHAGVPLACAASNGRAHPVFGLWPVALREDLRAALTDGLRRVDQWTARHGLAEIDFDMPDGDPFFNINAPADLAVAEQRLAGLAA